MSNLSQIEIFMAVVKHKSFIGAARALGLTGPAVSKQVQALEKRLGVYLLNRTTRIVSLTDEGQIYSQKAGKALSDLYEAEQEVLESKAHPAGTLKISLPASFSNQFLLEPIAQFSEQYPNVHLEIEFDERRVDLIAENFDLAIRISKLQDSNLIAKKLASCPILLCASPDFLKTHGEPKTPDDLEQLPAIIFNEHSNHNIWKYISQDGTPGVCHLKRAMATNTAEMIVEACLKGVGIAAIPIFACYDLLRKGKLCRLLEQYTTTPVLGIHALYAHREYQSTRLRLFIEMLTQHMAGLPWEKK